MRLSLFLAIVSAPMIVYAQEQAIVFDRKFALASIDDKTTFQVIVDDQVIDGCWTTPQSSKTAIELVIIQNKFGTLVSEDNWSTNLVIGASGYKHGEICIVNVHLTLYQYGFEQRVVEGNELTNLLSYPSFEANQLLSGQGAEMSNRIKETSLEFFEQLIVASEKERLTVIDEIEKTSASASAKALWKAQFE